MNLVKLFKKKPTKAMEVIVADWGREIFAANGRSKLVDACIHKYQAIAEELSQIELRTGYKIDKDWLKACIAQIVPSEACEQMFNQYHWNMNEAIHPRSTGAQTIENVDLSSAVGMASGSVIVRVLFHPINPFAPGAMIRNKNTGSVWEMGLRERNGRDYMIIGTDKNGKVIERIISPAKLKFYEVVK